MKTLRKTFIKLTLFVAVVLGAPNEFYGMGLLRVENKSNDVFILTYDEALRAANRNIAVMLDIDDEISEIEDRISNLRDELKLLESGRWTAKRLAILQAILFDIDSQIKEAEYVQEQFMLYSGLFLNQLFDSIVSIKDVGTGEGFSETFLAVMQFFFNAQLLDISIASMAHEHSLIFGELAIVYGGQHVREMIRAVRWNISEFERQISNLRLQQDAIRLHREYSLRMGIAALAEIDMRIELFKQSSAIAEITLMHLKARYEHGRLSYVELREALFRQARSQREIDELLLGRDSALRTLNHLIGQPLNQNTSIEVALERQDFFDDLDAFVNRTVQNSLLVRQLEINLTRARETKRDYTGNDRDTINELTKAYEREVLRLNQAKIAVEVAIRDNLSKLQALNHRKELLELELCHAHFILQATLHNYELRRTTAYRVYAAKLDIFVLESNIYAIQYQKWALAFLIENPMLV